MHTGQICKKKINQTRVRLVEERGSSTFNGKVSTEFWIWTTKFGELSSCIQNHNMVMHSMHIADICHDPQSQLSVVYFFNAGIFFGRTNANFWPCLANLSQILLFTGLYSAVVYQNWRISGMSMHNSASNSCVHWRRPPNVCLFKNWLQCIEPEKAMKLAPSKTRNHVGQHLFSELEQPQLSFKISSCSKCLVPTIAGDVLDERRSFSASFSFGHILKGLWRVPKKYHQRWRYNKLL